MADLVEDIVKSATKAVDVADSMGLALLGYSESDLGNVENALIEVGNWRSEMSNEQLTTLVQDFGCFVLEVGRRAFDGRYLWHDEREQPVLVVGEPDCRIAMITWDKVRGRIEGDTGDNIPFFYEGFAARARNPQPGTDILFM